ncbi:MAG: CFI-box-CTERM domain-containing protein, partial [Acidiferrobacterales bacterium]
TASSAFSDGETRNIEVRLSATTAGAVSSSAVVWSNEVDEDLTDNATGLLLATIGPAATGGGCYIATAAYGTDMEADVVKLRHFRDHYLLTNKPGQLFTKLYYKISPPLAAKISTSETLREWARISLIPLVARGRPLDDTDASHN